MDRLSVWILGDQLLARHPALVEAETMAGRSAVRVVLVESERRAGRLPYQRKRLVLLFSAMRHYAQALRQEGYTVDLIKAPTFVDGLRRHMAEWRPQSLLAMAASTYQGRRFQERDLERSLGLPVRLLPNSQFLVETHNPVPRPEPGRAVVMEYFYRAMRRHFQVLMTDAGQPLGGQWNYDRQNRRPLPPDLPLPSDPVFEPDALTRAVMDEVAAIPGTGTVDGFGYAVTRADAQAVLAHFLERRLPDFGPYEDAMTRRSHTLFHSLLSPYLNLGLLEPLELIRAAEEAYDQGRAPLNSVEGFVRQILGWREFMYWQYWRLMPALLDMNAWDARRPLPPSFWQGRSEMACLDHALARAHSTGYNHHIERLMLISNFCMLAGIDPAAVNDWFLSLYIDATDWVMPPNVIGMGLNADGGLTATKPYIASANYINKMGDFCGDCVYDHRQRHGPAACPFNFLYWNFLLEHEERLRANPRLGPNVLSLRHLDEEERAAVRRQASAYLARLDTRPRQDEGA